MRAFVLSGGSNRGPIQVGALDALLEAGVRPDFLVGTSVGGINAAYLAARGFSQETLDTLAKRWREVDTSTIYPGNIFTVAWRLLRRKDSLYSNRGMRKLIEEGLVTGITEFGHLQLPLFVPAADVRSSRLYMLGENLHMPVVDAVLASASVPVIHPPVRFGNLELVDGGILANVAASYAMDRGATEIYLINVSNTGQEADNAEGMIDIAFRSLNTMIVQSLLRDLARGRESDRVDLHHIYIGDFQNIWFKDFSHTEEMFVAGYRGTKSYLKSPKPLHADRNLHAWAEPSGPEPPGFRALRLPWR